MSIVVAGLVAAVVIVLVLLVFSDDSNMAKDLVGKAMPHMAIVQQKIEDLAPQINNLIENTPDVESEAAYQNVIAPIRAQVQAIDSELDAATISYDRMNGLKGLQDYKDYARVAMDLVRNDHTLTAQVNYYLDDMLEAARNSGGPAYIDPSSYTIRSSSFITMFNGLRGDAATLKEKADKMRATL
jgi:hypothetical protein